MDRDLEKVGYAGEGIWGSRYPKILKQCIRNDVHEWMGQIEGGALWMRNKVATLASGRGRGTGCQRRGFEEVCATIDAIIGFPKLKTEG